MNQRIDIAGFPVDNLTYQEVLGRLEKSVADQRKMFIVTLNPEMILQAVRNKDFGEIIKKADLVTPDGIGILWAAYYLSLSAPKGGLSAFSQLIGSLACVLFRSHKINSVLKKRITGVDLLPKIIDRSQKKGWRIFLLGASEGVAKTAAEQLMKKYPKANIIGWHAGSPSQKDDKTLRSVINNSKPNILFVAYGSPNQELWISRNLAKLPSTKVAIGVGGAFDFHAGKITRAPKWMRKVGLEWLWRLAKEPKRLSRIWNATVVFVKWVAIQKRGKKG